MTDYSELKRLAEAAKRDQHDYAALNDYGMAMPPAVALALIAENETIKDQFDECARLFVDATEQACKAQRERDQLKAENEALHDSIRYEEARFRLELAESERLRRLIGECVEYLNTNSLTQISSGSILHGKMSDAMSRGKKSGG